LTNVSAYKFNALIIDQSMKYVVSGNLKLLQDSIKCYKEFKKANILYSLKDLLFIK
jgi:hypothetical protein